MIILGIISLIVGIVLYFIGTNINNDIDAQLESFFNDGITNPGSTQETIGIILMIVGILLIVVGVIINNTNSHHTNTYNNTPDSTYAGTWLCKCGTRNSNYYSMCSNCNSRKANLVSNGSQPWLCPKCNRLNEHYVGTCGCGQTKP